MDTERLKRRTRGGPDADANAAAPFSVARALALGCLLLLILGWLCRPASQVTPVAGASTASTASSPAAGTSNAARDRLFARLPQRRSALDPSPTPEQVVSRKLSELARSRRDIVHAIAKKHGVSVLPGIERFFDAAEAGRWEEMQAAFKSLQELRKTEEPPEGFFKLWPAVLETFGCAEVAREWPAQQLLDYGEAVLGALRPGMVYVGGTDAGRFIPTLMTETGSGERHIVMTQNAFADGSYLEYLRFLHGDQIATLTADDSNRAFSDYLADARKRFRHDSEFPDEPKQLRPGEDVRMTENRIQVSGQVAVMSINERLLQTLMTKNPELSFALQESFPLRSTYDNAAPLGPILELGVQDTQSALSPERAAQSVDYWRTAARQLRADPEASEETLRAYSKLATAQANLFGTRQYSAEAEQAYRVATDIWPANVEAVGGLCALLGHSGRSEEARQLAADFERRNPGTRADLVSGMAMWNVLARPGAGQ